MLQAIYNGRFVFLWYEAWLPLRSAEPRGAKAKSADR